jgi:hypothetical protein
MNSVTIEGTQLVVEPRGLDKVWTFTRKLEIPWAHVRGATIDPGANAEPKGVRGPGLSVPGKAAGTFRRDGDKTFYNISRPQDTIVVELVDEEFQRLVLTVDAPRDLVQAINNAARGA